MAVQQLPAGQQKVPSRAGHVFERIVQKFGDFLMNSWVTLLSTLLGLIVGLAVAIPILSFLGLDSIAKPLFYSMHLICAQIPAHSFFLLGHQFGLCARNFSIYGSMFLGSLIFDISKKRIPAIPWWLWILFMVPMAWDGGTQLFGWRESTWELRVITGTLFGLGTMWFVLPLIHKTLLDTPHTPTPAPVQLQPSSQTILLPPQEIPVDAQN